MKIKIEFDMFGNFYRAATWLRGKHIVALASSWELAEEKLKAKLTGNTEPIEVRAPEAKEVEL